jgi:ABC-type polysaccharide/polyol phosphate transport system ATPase subunit
MEPAISLDRVWKRYVKYEDAPMLISRVIGLRARTRRSRLWALRDIDLEVAPGECIGVIGRNGSGKSTLLRLLAGVTAPSRGTVAVSGRVSPLIAVGVGFHPELTGRENVFVNGIVLGLTRRQIEERFDQIVDFAEVGEFIDTPVKFYSSGMFVRLGFSVAVAVDPAVLLVDEILSVGDLAFQVKCFDRMMEVRDAGTTVVVVSHNLNAIRRMCDRSIVLDSGRVCHDGDTQEGIARFHEILGATDEPDAGLSVGGSTFDVRARITRLELRDRDGAPTTKVTSSDEVVAQIDVEFDREVVDPVIGFNVVNEAGIHAYASHSDLPSGPQRSYAAGDRATFRVAVRMRLTTGSYTLGMNLVDGKTMRPAAVPARRYPFYVSNPSRASGIADLEARFGEVDGTSG